MAEVSLSPAGLVGRFWGQLVLMLVVGSSVSQMLWDWRSTVVIKRQNEAFWQKRFWKNRFSRGEWKWWVGLILVIVVFISTLYSISDGTFGEHLTPGVMILIFSYVTYLTLSGKKKKRDDDAKTKDSTGR